MNQTPEAIRRKGLQVLRKHLGRAGMIRFMQQFQMGKGDYARARHAWVDQITLEEIAALAEKSRSRAGKTRSKKKKP